MCRFRRRYTVKQQVIGVIEPFEHYISVNTCANRFGKFVRKIVFANKKMGRKTGKGKFFTRVFANICQNVGNKGWRTVFFARAIAFFKRKSVNFG